MKLISHPIQILRCGVLVNFENAPTVQNKVVVYLVNFLLFKEVSSVVGLVGCFICKVVGRPKEYVGLAATASSHLCL
jgi:hypothetical protein